MAGAQVRTLTRRDIAWAIRLTDLERWGYTTADFARLLALAPEGCFVATYGGKRVGITCTTTYGKVAFLGAVIVDPDFRGKHIGEALLGRALDHLDAMGVETVRLNAYLHVVPWYERLGFRGEYENVRYHGRATGAGTVAETIRTMRADEVSHLSDFDSTFFGANRRALLSRLQAEFVANFLVARDKDGIRGYIVANANGGSAELGPWVVDPAAPETAGHLLHALLSRLGPTQIAFAVPTRNEHHGRMAQELRLEVAFRTLRMYRGRDAHRGDPQGIFALAGLEKG